MVTTRAKIYNRQPSIIGEKGTSRGRSSFQILSSEGKQPTPPLHLRPQLLGEINRLEEEVILEDDHNDRIEEVNPLPPMDPPNPVDAMMAPRGLPILMPPNLASRAMPVHLPKFSGKAHEDPSNHIERYIEALVTNVIPEESYRLVWFSTTLEGQAYDWYRSHAPETFVDWPALQTAFLRQFRPETGQQSALVALTGMRQGPTEEISEYIRRFNIVITRFVGNHLTDETIKFYFIQGFNKQTTMREVLNSVPHTLNDAQIAARHVERIERENIRMWNRTVAPVPTFIPAHYVPPPTVESLHEQPYPFIANQPVPLDSRPPTPQLQWHSQPESSRFADIEAKFKRANDDLKEDVMKSIRSLGDQITMAISAKSAHEPPPLNETGNFPTNIWCRNCNLYGHSEQFCQLPKAQGPYVAPQPHQNLPNQTRGGQSQPKNVPCSTCGRMHPIGPGICWVESGVLCGNCGGNHPTDKCRRPKKMIRSDLNTTQNPPPNLFYNRSPQGAQEGYYMNPQPVQWYPQYGAQPIATQPGAPLPNPSQPLDTNRILKPSGSNVSSQYYMGIHPTYPTMPPPLIYPPPRVSQDARNELTLYSTGTSTPVGASSLNADPTTNQSTNIIIHENDDKERAFTSQDPLRQSLAVMTRQQRLDNPPLDSISEESSDSDEIPDIQTLREFLKNQTQENMCEPPLDQPSLEDAPLDVPLSDEENNLSRFVEIMGVGNQKDLVPKDPSSRAFNPAEDYDLWSDLCTLRANISIAQLIQVAPSLKKELKEGATVLRKPRKTMMTARIYSSALLDDGALEIDVSILDKVISGTLIDGGSGINIMPLSTMESLGLKVSGPSPYVVNVADQRPVTPLGQIVNCQMEAGGEIYTLTFHVLRLVANKTAYPLLLGRDWLRRANASERWSITKSSLAFGPIDNRSVVTIGSKHAPTKLPVEGKPKFEDEPHVENVGFLYPTLIGEKTSIDLGPIKNLGPGLYDWEDDGEFTTWLREHSNDNENSRIQTTNVITTTSWTDEHLDPYSNFLTLLDEVEYEAVYNLEMDGTQPYGLEELLNEEDILPPPLHFRKTSTHVEVGSDLPIHPQVPQDWYHGPTDPVHIASKDWQEVDVSLEGEEPRPIKVGSQLSKEEVAQYRDLVMEYRDIFAWSYKDLKGIPPEIVQHEIPLFPNAKPVRTKERRMNPRLQLIVKAELEKLLEAGFIKPVEITDWVSPMVLVKKKNGKLRVCIDYRCLNKVTQKDHFPIPFIFQILDEVSGEELYTFMDGYAGYNQMGIHPKDWHKTAFTTPWGTFICLKLPFGLCNGPSSFQRGVTFIFSDLLHKSMSVFIDDFSVQTSKISHLTAVKECFLRCQKNGLSLNPTKLYLAVERGVLLGYVVSKAGKEPDPEKVEVITNLQPPTSVKGIQRALGHFGWYRDVMEDYATSALPLTKLLRKDTPFVWTPECQEGFDSLKAKLTSFPCLVPPDWEKPFHVYCDASAVAVGATLCQPHGIHNKDRPIAFASRQLTASERNYSTTDRECLAMVFSVKKFRHYLLMNPVVFFVDHLALRYMVNKPDLSGRVARWVLLLGELDYTVVYKPGRFHLQADHLSRISEKLGTEEIEDDLPDANLFSITVTPTWDTSIFEFLSTQKFPEHLDANGRRKVRVNSRHFAIIANRLYRRGIDGVLRRCVSEPETSKILVACHDGTCGGHFSGRLTAQKILRAGYFWPTMFRDAHRYAHRCDACQRYARNDLHMALPLNPSLPLLPFEKWGIDYVGPIHPSSSRHNAYIILAVDYLTKWVEAKAVKIADKKTTAKFLFENIFSRFGVPRVLISDRGTHFLNDLIEELTTTYGIDHRKTTPYHPQTNGLAERVNQTIVRILRKTIQDNKRDWDTKLNAALWAYRTTFKVTTKQTPFALVYGIEAILPIEIEIPSLRIAIEARLPVSKSIWDRVLMLEGLSEARRLSAQHIETDQRRKKLAFDKCHKNRTLTPGTMVMLQDGKKLEFPGKFDAIWLGPYWIMEAYPNNTVQLATLDGTYFPTRTNGERCKVYHV